MLCTYLQRNGSPAGRRRIALLTEIDSESAAEKDLSSAEEAPESWLTGPVQDARSTNPGFDVVLRSSGPSMELESHQESERPPSGDVVALS